MPLVFACGGESLEVRTVSEYNFGKAIAGVRVQVNDLPWAETDADGRAIFDDVERPYTIRVFQVVRFDRAESALYPATVVTNVDVWSMIEQNANPLVLSVDEGPADDTERCVVSGTIAGASGIVPKMETGILSGSGRSAWEVSADAFSLVLPEVRADVLPLRALTFTPSETPNDFPVAYSSAGATDVPLGGVCGRVDGVQVTLAPVESDVWQARYEVPEPLAAGAISTNVSLAFSGAAYAHMPLGIRQLAGRTGTFEVTLPRFGTPTVGLSSYGEGRVIEEASDPAKFWERFEVLGFAARTRRELSRDESSPSLTLVIPVRLLAPDDGAALGPSTVFRWEPAGDGALYELHLTCQPNTPTGNVNVRVLQTRATELALPDFVTAEALLPGMRCGWTVGVVGNSGPTSSYAAPAWRVLNVP